MKFPRCWIDRKEQAESEIQDSRSQIERSVTHEREQVNGPDCRVCLAKRVHGEGNHDARLKILRGQRRQLTQLQEQRGAVEMNWRRKT